MVPRANGQMPPSARKRLVLPEPLAGDEQAFAAAHSELWHAHDLRTVGQADAESVRLEPVAGRLRARAVRVERTRLGDRLLEAGELLKRTWSNTEKSCSAITAASSYLQNPVAHLTRS